MAVATYGACGLDQHLDLLRGHVLPRADLSILRSPQNLPGDVPVYDTRRFLLIGVTVPTHASILSGV